MRPKKLEGTLRWLRWNWSSLVIPAMVLPQLGTVLADQPATDAERDSATSYSDPVLGFRLAIPQDWILTKTNFEVFHYDDVFLTINNQRANLAIRKQVTRRNADGSPQTEEFGSKVAFDQMRPGEVHLAIGYFDGPGGPTMQPDEVGQDLLNLLTTNSIVATKPKGLSQIHLRFFKRGRWWNISGYLREPILDNEGRLLQTLRSLRFLDTPVANVTWAESLAWKHLPLAVRSMQWPVVSYAGQRPRWGPRTLVVEMVDSGYMTEFRVEDKRWKYLVLKTGEVIPKPDADSP